MTDGSLRLLNVYSSGVPFGSYLEEDNLCSFEFDPTVVPMGPPGPKPSDFDPPIIFADKYTPSQQSPIGNIDCRVVAADWAYVEGGESSFYQVSILVGDVEIMPTNTLVAGDEGPLTVLFIAS